MATSPVIQTWILNEDHSIATQYEVVDDAAVYFAFCKCGWRAQSGSAGLRNWNVEGHASDVLKGELCHHCRAARATWNEILCSDCASLSEDEVEAFKVTGVHPRVPVQ